MAKAVVKKSDDLALELIQEDVGAGMENADKDSFAIPFLRVLQKLSPQCDESSGSYVEGAKGGMLYNSVTGKLYDGKEGVLFMPCAFTRRFIKWGPRGSDQGFKGEYFPEDIARMRDDGSINEVDGALMMGEDRVVDTRNHYGLLLDEDGAQQIVLPLSSTQIKKSKQLMSILGAARIKGVTPPTWLHKIRITTVPESNDRGSWYGVKFAPDGYINDRDLYEAGRNFHELSARLSVHYEEERTEAF